MRRPPRPEDAKGSEELALHAQRDMNTVVKHDQTLVVETGNRQVAVKTGDEQTRVEQGSLTETICRLRSTEANQIQVSQSRRAGRRGDRRLSTGLAGAGPAGSAKRISRSPLAAQSLP